MARSESPSGDAPANAPRRFIAVTIDLLAAEAGPNNDRRLALDALKRAVAKRHSLAGLVHHSDRGSTYASADYRDALVTCGAIAGMSRKGDCWDAVVESFFGTVKRELIHRRSWPTRREAADAIHEYIEVFYNRRRRHTTLGGKPPAVFEALAERRLTQAA